MHHPHPTSTQDTRGTMHWLACLALAATAALSHAAEIRTFYSTDGTPLRASFEGMAGDKAILRLEDGRTFEIDTHQLSSADQTHISEITTRSDKEAAAINKAAGHDITNATPFPQRKARDLAKSLKLRPESKSKYGRSWRLYAASAKKYQLFGTTPYSVALYSDADGLVSNISIVYANKGDFGSTAGFGKDHFKGGTTATAESLAEAMDHDETTVSAALTSVLGPGRSQYYGERGSRRKITRWDWNSHAFILSNVPGEYVGLAIVTTEHADSGGRTSPLKDAELKQRLIESVVRKDNGDVYLSEIPMVNQGPKGYCVPATFERVMRTMGLEADMYLLAMAGETTSGKGFSIDLLLDSVRSQVYAKGRRTRDDYLKQLRIRDVKRYIDQGIPIMWALHSVDAYNKIADENSKRRAKVTDWKSYAESISTEAAALAATPKPGKKHHICMIVGYNESTAELAVSDSWGPAFERRWVPVSVADWASQGGVFMILP